MRNMDCLLKLILLSFCFFLGSLAIEDSLYHCAEWDRCCVEEDTPFSSMQADFKIVTGQYFNCYFGYTPKCFKAVPKDIKKPEDHCKELESTSEFERVFNGGRCIVNAESVDDDADHTLLFTSIYS